MKTLQLIVLLTSLAIHAHAEHLEGLRDIQAERRSVLNKIVSHLRLLHDKGVCDILDLFDAQIRLNKFDRNQAEGWEEKKVFQSKIIELEKNRLSVLQRRHNDAVAGTGALEVLRAKERYLAAREKLIKLSRSATKSAESGPRD